MPDFSKVIFVSPGGRYQGGGLGTMTREMEAGLNHVGKTAAVLNTRSEGSVLKTLYETPFALLTFLAFALTNRSLVVHVQLTQRLSVLREGLFILLARLFRFRAVLHHHGAEFPDFVERTGPGWLWFTSLVCRTADVNIVLGERWRVILRDRLGVAAERIVLVHNAIRTVSRAERSQRDRPGPARLLLLANLTPRKGVQEALLALKGLRESGVDAVLSLAGGGQVEHYGQVAAKLGIADHCHFLGWVDRAATERLLCEADILIVPSHQEGFPMSIIEAFAARLPVVTTPVGSIPELVAGGTDCLFVPVGDPDALRSAIQELIANGELRERLAENAHRTFQRALNHERMMDKLLSLWGGRHPSLEERVP